MFKKTFAIAGISLLALTGCAAETPPQPTVTVTETAETQAAQEPQPEADGSAEKSNAPGPVGEDQIRFMYAVKTTDFRYIDEDIPDMIKAGEAFCGLYDAGASFSDVTALMREGMGYKYTADELFTLHGAGIAALCPEHREKVLG